VLPLSCGDRVSLAPRVRLEGDAVVDDARGIRVPANRAALRILSLADGRPVEEIDVPAAREFCDELNRRLLVNVGEPLLRRLAPVRFGLVPGSRPRRVRGVLAGTFPCAVGVAVLALPAALFVHAPLLALTTGAGVLLHEAGHAAALRGIPHVLVRRGLRPRLLHPRLPLGRTLVVAAAGPLAPALLALPLRGTLALPLAAHALALTVAAPDGRNACGLG
jgi:hypothetical protein